MMTKIYGIRGYNEANIEVPFNRGRSFIRCNFTGGDVHHGKPARYITSDTGLQAIIENSPYFGTQIQLLRTIGDAVAPSFRGEEQEPERMKSAPIMHNPVSQPTEQAIIRQAEEQAAKEATRTEAPVPEKKEKDIHAGITDIDGVRLVLKSAGAKAPTLSSIPAMQRFAASHNIEFPDFKF